MGILADNYDKKTDHGLNPTPSANEAVDLVIKERDNAPKAGEQHDVKPDDSKDKGKTTEHGSGMLFEPGRGQFSFGGDLTIVSASDPADTVCGRGIVNIQPLYFIGQQKNGTYLLSDTSLQIFDVQTSNVLMCAYLYELAYMPSSLPGYAGMIQGYLDIPPEIPPGYGGGVSNSIGSSFLSDMQAASASGLPTTFWAFTASSLLDAQGNLQTDSIPTTIVLGVATPSLNPTNIIWQVTGTQLTLSWPVDHIGWRLQAQTNSLSTRLGANWFDMAGSSTTNRFIITMTPANGAVFYRLVYSN
jgi:hypothetical protein